MSRGRFGLLALLVLALGGCPFTSDTPLSDPASARPDSRLIGTWRTRDKESGDWNTLTILAFDEHGMVGFTPEGTSGKVIAFRAFPTVIGGETFLNFRELGRDAAGGDLEEWYYARYRIVETRLLMSFVDDGLFENRRFEGSADLQEFFRQHLSDPRLYSPDAEQAPDAVWEHVPEAPEPRDPKS
ncbi:MAG: hypothetical protein ACLQDL_00310 [Spirochaetia bacterium]